MLRLILNKVRFLFKLTKLTILSFLITIAIRKIILLVSRGSLVLKALAAPLMKLLDFVRGQIDPMLRHHSEHFQKPTTAVECVGLKDFV